VPRLRQYQVLVFFCAFACLVFELVISRLADFHLGFMNSFLAMTITFFGLALGSLHVHFRRSIVERFQPSRALLLVAGVCASTLVVIYIMFARYTIFAVTDSRTWLTTLAWKTLFFTLIFMIPFYVFGRILTVCYHIAREHIGRIYSVDFFGAALGCFLTPVLFHFISLPEVATLLLAAIGILLAAHFHRSWLRTGVLAVILAGGVWGFHAVVFSLEHSLRFDYEYNQDNPPETHEVTSRWNEFSRVQLVRFDYPNGSNRGYKIIHDNARSNVNMTPYVPGRTAKPSVLDAAELPFILGRKTDDIMVMFAGCGNEMVRFNEFTGGKANITGVELNGLCRDIARDTPEVASYRLAEFYKLPNIDFRIEEGRSFLMRNTRKYDIIFVGSSAPTSVAVTGHTRKYLYTVEAFDLYLNALKPNGLLVFDFQPLGGDVETMKATFAQRGVANFPEHVVLISSVFGRFRAGTYDFIVSSDAFTPEEILRLSKFTPAAEQQIRYAPFHDNPPNEPIVATVLSPPEANEKVLTDDRPYSLEVDFANYRLRPSEAQLKNDIYYMSWVKVTTLILICGLALLVIAASCLSRARRPPFSILVYLLLTGFSYMLVEVVFIAKLELFLQNLLVSMASVISIFLLTSGIGSLTHKRVAGRLGMTLFPLIVAGLVAGSPFALEFLLHHLLWLPLFAKLLVVAIVIAPVGIALGMFYPHAVGCLVQGGHENAVPITYGISTLSSVIGATYAMTVMLTTGFNQVLYQAAAGYMALWLFLLIYALTVKKRVLV